MLGVLTSHQTRQSRLAVLVMQCDTYSRQGAKSEEGATRKVKSGRIAIGICRIEVGNDNGLSADAQLVHNNQLQ